MLILLSPSKTMQQVKPKVTLTSRIRFSKETEYLVNLLKKYSQQDIRQLMSVSDKIAFETYKMYQEFDPAFSVESVMPALYAFKGDVYQGLDVMALNEDDVLYAQKTVRILSGLYGVLRPLDGILPYRLEMGSSLKTHNGPSLYAFWSDKITSLIQKDLDEEGHDYIVNLASKEYIKSVNTSLLRQPVIEVDFYEMKNGKKTFASVFAKRARGLMASFIVREKIKEPSHLEAFHSDGYCLDRESSSGHHFVFIR
jgi:cytoplasmic iron level regulating protein YaaA (DUF328/UPF0246 family)